jgi:hypothetical protein
VLEYSANGGRKWKTLLTIKLGSRGYWSATGNYAAGRVWRAQWASPAGTVYDGATISAFSASGRLQ